MTLIRMIFIGFLIFVAAYSLSYFSLELHDCRKAIEEMHQQLNDTISYLENHPIETEQE